MSPRGRDIFAAEKACARSNAAAVSRAREAERRLREQSRQLITSNRARCRRYNLQRRRSRFRKVRSPAARNASGALWRRAARRPRFSLPRGTESFRVLRLSASDARAGAALPARARAGWARSVRSWRRSAAGRDAARRAAPGRFRLPRLSACLCARHGGSARDGPRSAGRRARLYRAALGPARSRPCNRRCDERMALLFVSHARLAASPTRCTPDLTPRPLVSRRLRARPPLGARSRPSAAASCRPAMTRLRLCLGATRRMR